MVEIKFTIDNGVHGWNDDDTQLSFWKTTHKNQIRWQWIAVKYTRINTGIYYLEGWEKTMRAARNAVLTHRHLLGR
jgi:hypothetical protein